MVLSFVWAIPAAAAPQSAQTVPLEFVRAAGLPGLDMRDAFNRSVARAAVDRGIRRGVRAQEEGAARLSKLPALGALLSYLDTLDQLAAKLRAPSGQAHAQVAAAAHRVPKRAALGRPVLRRFALPPVVSPLAALNPLQLHTTPGRVRVLPLLL